MTVIDFASYQKRSTISHPEDDIIQTASELVAGLIAKASPDQRVDIANALLHEAIAIHAHAQTGTEEVAQRILVAVQQIAHQQ